MQRILSGERARCIESSQEFVTKKLCISCIIVCAFFSVLGGYFLGKYATEKTAASKKSLLDQKNQFDVLFQLSISIDKISNLTKILSVFPNFNTSELYAMLQCDDYKPILPDLNQFMSNFSIGSQQIITTDLNALRLCYNNISNFLENVVFPH